MTLQVEYADIDVLKPFVGNPREHSERNIEDIVRSIKRFGWTNPILVRRGDNMVIAGHARLEAARRNGLAQVPVIYLDLSKNDAKLYAITDNRTAETSTWELTSLSALVRELDALPDVDIRDTGFTLDELDELLEPLESDERDEDFDADAAMEAAEETEPVTKPGDIWICGQHRVMCGDSTKAEDVQRLMAGKRAVLFATDPPFLVSYDGRNHPSKRGHPDKNKDWSDSYRDISVYDIERGEEFYDGFIRVAIEHAITEDAAWYCWHASRHQAMLERVWQRHGAFVHQQIVWVKDRGVLTRSWYLWQHEPCFFGWLKGHKPKRTADDYPSSVWQVPTIAPGTKTLHPTSKPVELFAIPMRQHTRRGELCYEPFAGSGSQLIAAEQLGRICYGMEIEPRYCDVICRRYYEFTGDVPVLEETGEPFPIEEA